MRLALITIDYLFGIDDTDDIGDFDDTGYTTCLNVRLTTKSYGRANSWTLGSCRSDGGYRSYNNYTQKCCVSPGNYDLVCKDSQGDGWHSGYIEIGDAKYCENFGSGTTYTSEINIPERGKDSQIMDRF